MTTTTTTTTAGASTQPDNLKARILAAVDCHLARGQGLFTCELEMLNSLLPLDTTGMSVALELNNPAGYQTPYYVWRFKMPVFEALVELFHAGALSVRFVKNPQLAFLVAGYHCDKPLLTDMVTQGRHKQQYWILMEVERNLHPDGGHWFKPNPDQPNAIAFHWNDRASTNNCPLAHSATHIR